MRDPDLLGMYLRGAIIETKTKRKLKCMLKWHDWESVHDKHYEPFEMIIPERFSMSGSSNHYKCTRCNKIMKCPKCDSPNIRNTYGKMCGTCGNMWGFW